MRFAPIDLNMDPVTYSLNDVALIIKRHAHDVRNALNGMDLELTLLEGDRSDPVMLKSVGKLRDAGAEISRLIQGLVSKYSLESAEIVPVVQLTELWNVDARHVAAGVDLRWSVRLGGECVRVEVSLMRSLLKDALGLAIQINGKRPLQIECRSHDGEAVFEIMNMGGTLGAGIIESQQSFWAALRRLGDRAQLRISPTTLACTGTFPIRVSIPLQPAP